MEDRIESVVFVGWVLLLISIIMDDITTHILFKLGFGILETNPIFQYIQNITIFGLILVCIYGFIGWAWYYINNKYRYKVQNKKPHYKIYDAVVFLFCLILMFIVVMKVSAGIVNIQTMVTYSTDEGKIVMDQGIEKINQLKINEPERYDQFVTEYYNDTNQVSYLKLLFISMCAYLLFRLGHRVTPWDLD